MSYIDGLVIPVPADQRQAFIDHARAVDSFFIDNGALRVVETWEEDVPTGQHTDFRRAVAAQEGEAIAFSWIEWPDKATRDAAFEKMRGEAELMALAVPFDGKRMIFGGFMPIIDMGGK